MKKEESFTAPLFYSMFFKTSLAGRAKTIYYCT